MLIRKWKDRFQITQNVWGKTFQRSLVTWISTQTVSHKPPSMQSKALIKHNQVQLDFWVLFLAWWVSSWASEQRPFRRAKLEPQPGRRRGKSPSRCYKDPQIFLSFQNHMLMPTVSQTLRPNCGPHGGHGVSQEGSKISRVDRRSHIHVGGQRQSTPKQEKHQASSTGSMKWWTAWHARKQKQLRPQQSKAAAGAGRGQ